MFRTAEHKADAQSGQPLEQQEQGVNAPPPGVAAPLDQCGYSQQGQQAGQCRYGRGRLPGSAVGGRQQRTGLFGQPARVSLGVDNAGLLHEPFGIERCEALRLAVGGLVGFGSQQQVLSQLQPGVGLGIFVHDVAQRLVRIGLRPYDLAVNGRFNHVDGPCRTVVVEEAVSVGGILGQQVFAERIHQLAAFVGREVEHLFVDAAPFGQIGIVEQGVRHDPQLIVRLAFHKPPREVRLAEREGAVVEHPVTASVGVDFAHAQGRVAIQFVGFLSRCHGEQAHLH